MLSTGCFIKTKISGFTRLDKLILAEFKKIAILDLLGKMRTEYFSLNIEKVDPADVKLGTFLKSLPSHFT